MIFTPQIHVKSTDVPKGFDKHYIKRIRKFLSETEGKTTQI